MEIIIKRLGNAEIYSFLAIQEKDEIPVSQDQFVQSVQAYVQTNFPNRQYNLFKERNTDTLSVIAIFDLNEMQSQEIKRIVE